MHMSKKSHDTESLYTNGCSDQKAAENIPPSLLILRGGGGASVSSTNFTLSQSQIHKKF